MIGFSQSQFRSLPACLFKGIILTLFLAGVSGCGFESKESSRDGIFEISSFLSSGADDDFSRADPGKQIVFPQDHGAHEDFREEWWYFTGNLETEGGKRLGYQLTFFRFRTTAFEEYADSQWSSENTWMAHLAVSDPEYGMFLSEQDYSRGTLGLAGATGDPLAVWINGWSARGMAPEAGGISAQLKAKGEDIGIELSIQTRRPAVLHGENGYSQKSHEGSSASHYYSYPRLQTEGSIRVKDQAYTVSGLSWMDHEWSTSVLQPGQSGWDWFAIRLSDGSSLMAFQVRDETGRNYRYARLTREHESEQSAPPSDIDMTPTRHWRDEDGIEYPVDWRIKIPSLSIDLEIGAVMDAQKVDLDFSYWEGLIDVSGNIEDKAVSGEGYLEMTGYD